MFTFEETAVKTRNCSLFVFLLGVVVFATTVAARDLVLVDNGRPRAVIVVSADANAALRETADDLADIIERMSGARLPIESVLRGRAIQLGPADSAFAPLEYHVSRSGDRIIVRGGSEQGIINGAYAFAEYLGARFYLPGPLGKYLPESPTIAVGNIEFGDAPDYRSVSGFGGHPNREQSRLWLRRNRMEGFPGQYHGHNWRSIIHPSERDAHPEWFALQSDGTRSDQLCTTNPDVLDSAVAVISRYFDARPDAPMYSLSPNDNDDFCQCERCRALDVEIGVNPVGANGSYTDRLVYFFNQIAVRLEDDYPEKQLAFYAYINHTAPPEVVTPHRMLLPVACHTPWDYCQNHAIDDPNCRRNARFAATMQGWDSLVDETYVYDYYGSFAWFGPMGIVHAIRRDLPLLHAHGVTGFNSETHANWWSQGLNWYVASKLFWDIDADVDQIVADWHAHLYGPAASQMMAFWRMYEDAAQNTPYDRDAERGWVMSMDRAFFARTDSLLNAAEATIATSDLSSTAQAEIRERIRKLRFADRVAQAQAPFEIFKANNGDIYPVLAAKVDPLDVLAEYDADSLLHDVMDGSLGRGSLMGAKAALKNIRDVWDATNLSEERRDQILGMLADGADTDAARALGFVTNWKVAGFFYAPTAQGLRHPFPPEHELDLDASYATSAGDITWRDYTVENAFGVINFRDLYPDQSVNYAVAYAYAEVEYHGRKARGTIRLGSNDGVAVWHNGDLVLVSDVSRPCNPDQDRIMVPLTRGTNRFLVKVFNTQNNFKMTMRVLDDAERPIMQDTGLAE